MVESEGTVLDCPVDCLDGIPPIDWWVIPIVDEKEEASVGILILYSP